MTGPQGPRQLSMDSEAAKIRKVRSEAPILQASAIKALTRRTPPVAAVHANASRFNSSRVGRQHSCMLRTVAD